MGWIKKRGEASGVEQAVDRSDDSEGSGGRTADGETGEEFDQGSAATASPEPASSKEDVPREAQPSIISFGVEIEGHLRSAGPIHVEGHIEGSLESDQVSIGSTGEVLGEVRAVGLSIYGTFEGEGACVSLTMGASANYRGKLQCETLELASGAVLEGTVEAGPA